METSSILLTRGSEGSVANKFTFRAAKFSRNQQLHGEKSYLQVMDWLRARWGCRCPRHPRHPRQNFILFIDLNLALSPKVTVSVTVRIDLDAQARFEPVWTISTDVTVLRKICTNQA